jgi:uncharacterized protein YhaN
MPVVQNDLLGQFDDGWAAAVLKPLAELAKRSQLVFFKHHEQMLRLPGSCHENPGLVLNFWVRR